MRILFCSFKLSKNTFVYNLADNERKLLFSLYRLREHWYILAPFVQKQMYSLLHVTIVGKKHVFFFLIIDLIAIHCRGRLIEATVYFIQAMKIHKYCFLVNKINICKHYSSFISESKHI